MQMQRHVLLVCALACLPGSPSIARAKPGASAIDIGALVDAHNRARAKHCAPPLKWSAKVASSAQKWANTLRDRGCVLGHSGGAYGENLAAGTAGTLDASGVVGMWYGEVAQYSFRRGGF